MSDKTKLVLCVLWSVFCLWFFPFMGVILGIEFESIWFLPGVLTAIVVAVGGILYIVDDFG